MGDEFLFLIVYALFEGIESRAMQGESIGEALSNLAKIYRENIARFFLANYSTSIFLLFLIFGYGIQNIWLYIALGFKITDTIIKLLFMKKIIDGDIKEGESIYDAKVGNGIKFAISFTYLMLLYFGLNQNI